MVTKSIALPTLHPNQIKVVQSTAKYKVIAAGRRFGKSFMCAAEASFHAMVYRYPVWWVAPTYKNTIDAWKSLVKIARDIPKTEIFKDEMLIEFPGGGSVQVISAANPNNVRGGGLGFVIYDECAYGQEIMWTEVLAPALLERQGGAMFISTPNGYNWFFDMFKMGESKQPKFSDYEAFHFSSYDNPYLDPVAIDKLKTTMTVKQFDQEIMAVFSQDALGVFRDWNKCLTNIRPRKPAEGHFYVAGVDWGRSNDYTVVSVWDVQQKREVWLERFNDLGWEVQRNRVKAITERWGVGAIFAEENAMGEPIVEAMANEGMPVYGMRMTNQLKTAIVQAMALAIEQGEVRFLDDKEGNEEFQTFEQEILPSGLIRYSAPGKRHDDIVIARCLAYSGIHDEIGEPVEMDWG